MSIVRIKLFFIHLSISIIRYHLGKGTRSRLQWFELKTQIRSHRTKDEFSDILHSNVFSLWERVFAKASNIMFANTKDTSLDPAIDSRDGYWGNFSNKDGTRYTLDKIFINGYEYSRVKFNFSRGATTSSQVWTLCHLAWCPIKKHRTQVQPKPGELSTPSQIWRINLL